jgi:PAS domain-containing protein
MPDLILMDLIANRHSDVFAKIKELQIPVIYLTSNSDEEAVKKALITQPYGYLLKPFDNIELKFSIELAIYKSKIEKQLRESEEKYRTLFEQDPDYNILIGTDGKILDVNKSITNLAGISKKKLISTDFSKLKIIP